MAGTLLSLFYRQPLLAYAGGTAASCAVFMTSFARTRTIMLRAARCSASTDTQAQQCCRRAHELRVACMAP